MFTAFLYIFRGNYVPTIRRKYRTYAITGICHLYRVTNTRCRICTVFSPDDGHIVCPKLVQKNNKHVKEICGPSWFYLRGHTVNET